jgi:lipopolysaccharide/colanic/teichoic acid biosynthesis glycosyltransferase
MRSNASQANETVTVERVVSEQETALLQGSTGRALLRAKRRSRRASQEPPISIVRNAGTLYELSKRIFDLMAGTILLMVTAPFVLAAAIWIRLETKGSPFFFQTRLGKGGRPFRIFKLRGMYIDARQRFPDLYDYSHNRDLEFHFHYNEDPRVTKAGRFLRRTSIDELPNLWNVVVGDMSLVGPRPEIPDILDMYGPFRDEYLSVKPGITCRSKITGRDHLTKRETIESDLRYIRRRNFREDLSILWTTFMGVICRRDVY